mgnify:CR=1 FL=1
MAKILLVTDAWGNKQINGVVTTLKNLVKQAHAAGDTVHVFHPGRCKIRFPLPGYTEITLGIMTVRRAKRLLKKQSWDHIHIATPEGFVGTQFAKACRKLDIPFSTSCHTKFPEFINARLPWIPVSVGWAWMRSKYKGASHVLTTTESMVQELKQHGFDQDIQAWSRGVDREVFNPIGREEVSYSKPLLVCVGRVSQEKGLDDFCQLDYPGATLMIVGDGPYRKTLEKRYPHVIFAGAHRGKELAAYFRNADVFVFPSRADTFGVVIIEAMATGTPVAAFPVTGPKDIIKQGKTGYVDENLLTAVKQCQKLDRQQVYEQSLEWCWENCYQQFRDILLPAR